MRAKFTLIAAVSLAACATPDSQLAKHSTEDLERRHAELTQRIKDDELGVYFGPIRWVSHAIEERGVTQENQAIEQKLTRRPQNVLPVKEISIPKILLAVVLLWKNNAPVMITKIGVREFNVPAKALSIPSSAIQNK